MIGDGDGVAMAMNDDDLMIRRSEEIMVVTRTARNIARK